MEPLLKGKKENGANLEAINFIFIPYSFSLFVIFKALLVLFPTPLEINESQTKSQKTFVDIKKDETLSFER